MLSEDDKKSLRIKRYVDVFDDDDIPEGSRKRVKHKGKTRNEPLGVFSDLSIHGYFARPDNGHWQGMLGVKNWME